MFALIRRSALNIIETDFGRVQMSIRTYGRLA